MSQQKELSFRDSIYLSDDPEEKTFKYDQQLPPLPVPTIQQSIYKLLESIKPISTDETVYRETESKALALLQDANVNEVQELLLQRARKEKNWLEAWWLEFAYLRSRKPLIPYSNMSAPLPILKEWPKLEPINHMDFDKVRRQRAALSIHFSLSFWQMIRLEAMKPMIHKGVPWSMNQFRFLFNTVRRPGEPKDELISWFRTVDQGLPESTEVIIIHKGHIFAIKPIILLDSEGRDVAIMTSPQIEQQLKSIEDQVRELGQGPGIGALTTHERSEWVESRHLLSDISNKNKQILERIEKSCFVLILDDELPDSMNDIFHSSMCGEPRNRWADKSFSTISFRNGTFGASADHTPYDGFCTAIMTHYLITSVEECGGSWNAKLADLAKSDKFFASLEKPEVLNFDLNDKITNLIEEACKHFRTVTDTIVTLHGTFTSFGKALTKEHKMHPEAFIQCAIHAAYYKQHKAMAPAYVTASTRRFHNGRTETCRSCYPEMKEFAIHLASHSSSQPKVAYQLLKKSADKFQWIMNEASQGMGCDRHLLGLYLLAILNGRKIPELFDDELVQRTNNYILSMSCAGFWNVCGGVPPLVEEGYGCFYGIEDNQITFGCTAYKSCKDTNLQLFYSKIQESLLEMEKICLNGKL